MFRIFNAEQCTTQRFGKLSIKFDEEKCLTILLAFYQSDLKSQEDFNKITGQMEQNITGETF